MDEDVPLDVKAAFHTPAVYVNATQVTVGGGCVRITFFEATAGREPFFARVAIIIPIGDAEQMIDLIRRTIDTASSDVKLR